jgi:hypothetical protein
MGSSTAAVAAETVATWSRRRIGWPVVVVVGSVVVVVDSVVVGATVVVGAVRVGWVVVAPNVVRAPVIVVRPTAGSVPLGAGWASGAVAGLVGVSGSAIVQAEDGSETRIGPGDGYVIQPGHDAWVLGDEPWVTVDFSQAMAEYAKPS